MKAKPIELSCFFSATDERADLATLRVSCYIPGLVVKRKFTTKKFIPKFIKQADNAVVKTNFQEECVFCVSNFFLVHPVHFSCTSNRNHDLIPKLQLDNQT